MAEDFEERSRGNGSARTWVWEAGDQIVVDFKSEVQ